MTNATMYYHDYLQLQHVLNSQHPKSFEHGNSPAHDEMLFIIIHQASELWFKQILFELDFVMGVFSKHHINDNSEDLNLVRHRLHRITRINDLLIQQVGLLDTMTPLDFLAFRNLLTPASGFQSLQFRLIEAKLGLRLTKRHQSDYYKRTNEGGFTTEHYDTLGKVEEEMTLLQLVNNWLERMPFFEIIYWQNNSDVEPAIVQHPFWHTYRQLYKESLTDKEQQRLIDFDRVFMTTPAPAEETGIDIEEPGDLSPAAMRAALFIMLYRDFPMFQTSYQILDSLVEIDHLMSNWRHRHFTSVRRMIGMRVGTGNTSGAGYLAGAMNSHFIFHDIAGLSTFIIERKKLPTLPKALVQKLTYA